MQHSSNTTATTFLRTGSPGRHLFAVTLWLVLSGFGHSAMAQTATEVAGRAVLVQGAVSAQRAGGGLRLLEKGAALYRDDTLSTARDSFVIVRLRDGTAFTLRPDSAFRIDSYADAEGRESAVFSLLRGGFRAITGLIGKRNPDAYRISTPVATIGVRGTKFDARLCERDCAEEEQKSKPVEPPVKSRVVARVVTLTGTLQVRDPAGTLRKVVMGGPLYVGDTLITGKSDHGVIAFRDDSRAAIQPQSEFVVEDYGYDRQKPEQGSFTMNLLRGGLRAVTGSIGKQAPEKFKVKTPTAIIGVRGTGFDVYHKNPTWASTWLGTILFELPGGGALAVTQGQTIFLPGAGAEPVYLDAVPLFMQGLPAENPGDVEVDPNTFSTGDPGGIVPGLYLRVVDGHVVFDQNGNLLHLGGDESGLATGDGLIRLEVTPNFLLNDVIPAPDADPKLLELLGLLGDDFGSSEFLCEVR